MRVSLYVMYRYFDMTDHARLPQRFTRENRSVLARLPDRACAPAVRAHEAHAKFPLIPRDIAMPKTLYDKIWDAHVVHEDADGTSLLYIDRHLVHEVTSPQAFEGLRMAGRTVRAPDKTIAVPDHNVPTTEGRDNPDQMPEDSRIQVAALDTNAKEFGIITIRSAMCGRGSCISSAPNRAGPCRA